MIGRERGSVPFVVLQVTHIMRLAAASEKMRLYPRHKIVLTEAPQAGLTGVSGASTLQVITPLLGKHNVYNVLAAVAVGISLNINLQVRTLRPEP